MRHFLLLCYFLILIPVQAQDDTPLFGTVLNTEQVSEGYILFSPIQTNIAYLINNEGRVINQWQSDYRMLSVYLLENGHLLTSVVVPNNAFPVGGTGRVEEYDWEGNLVWSFDYNTPEQRLHHDIERLPNGNILMSAWERISPDDFISLGLHPENFPEEGDPLYYDYLIEVNPLTNDIVWEWRFLDHIVQNHDLTLSNYGQPADYPHLIDINFSNLTANVLDRTHINAISYNPDLEQIMVSSHFHSELWIIDHNSGDLLYRWGNPEAYRRGTASDRQLFFQHHPHWLDNGNILIFNNGAQPNREFSTVIEIDPPLLDDGTYHIADNTAYAPTEPIWEYRANPADNFFARNVSGAQRLGNGNTFITDGTNGRLFEITASGEIVWEYLNPVFTDEAFNFRAAIFRATRYHPDYPAFVGRELVPQDIIPLIVVDVSN